MMPQLICLVLAILLVWQVLSGVYSLFSLDKALLVSHDQPRETQNNLQKRAKVVKAQPIFGDYVPKNINEAEVKQSMLDLKVVGIMFAKDSKRSHVIIQTSSGLEQTFRVGDSLPGGAVIKGITADGMLVMRNGSLESLSLPKTTLIFEPPAAPLGSSNEEGF
jgi:general secretion pathway protein C